MKNHPNYHGFTVNQTATAVGKYEQDDKAWRHTVKRLFICMTSAAPEEKTVHTYLGK